MKRIYPDVKVAAYDLLENFYTPAEAEVELIQRYSDRAPSLRQLQRYKIECEPRDASAHWSLSEEVDRYGCSLVPPVLAAVIEKSSGRRDYITIEEAKWVIRTQLAAPDLDPWNVWLVARAYMRRHQQEASTADFDHFLAFAPWRSNEAGSRYAHAVVAGWAAPTPTLVKSLIRGIPEGLDLVPHPTGPQQIEQYLESLKEGKEAPNGG